MSTITLDHLAPTPDAGLGGGGPDLLTVSEVARYLRVSSMTVYRLLDRGELQGSRVGRAYRVSRDDLAAYLDATKVV